MLFCWVLATAICPCGVLDEPSRREITQTRMDKLGGFVKLSEILKLPFIM
jgi:hypothetical protein